MKLLYITNGIHGSGGLERVLSIKASYLASHYDYDVTILTLNSGNKDLFYNFDDRINFYNINASGNALRYFLSYRNGIKKALKEIEPDIVSVCDDGLKGMLFPILFSRKTPVIYERHAPKLATTSSPKRSFFKTIKTYLINRLMNFGGDKFDKFIVLTKGNLTEWNLNNLKVIPNPLPFEIDETYMLENKKVLVVGKQSYQKGYDMLLSIWSIVQQKHTDWKLEVYGKLDATLGLEKMLEELNLKDTVSFFPPTKNIIDKYKEASIYCMTSRFEGFGMVLIEAMSFGLPCVSFDCPFGPADIITNNEDGFLVENGNHELFASKLSQLIADKELRVCFGVAAKKNVEKYDVHSVAAQWDGLFKKLVLR